MANWYVYHGAGGAADGTSWTNAYTTLSGPLTKTAGDTIYVAHDHVQTQASALSLTGNGTDVSPHRVYCVNRAGSVPPVLADLRTTAQVSTTGAFAISIGDSWSECYGIIFSAGSAASAANITVASTNAKSVRLVNCSLILANTSATSRIALGTNTSQAVLENCTCTFGATGQAITLSTSRQIIRNTTGGSFVLGSTTPSSLFTTTGSNTGFLLCEGVDLSGMGSGEFLVNVAGSNSACPIVFKDCKLGASVGVTTGAFPTPGSFDIMLINCDSGDTNYRTERHNYMGVQTIETTIKRTGGASDGTTGIAWKIVTSAAATHWPFESLPISIWNETVGSSITVSIEGIWGTGAVPTNAQIWINVYYPGTSGSALASKATSGNGSLLTAGTNIPAGSGTWGGSTTKFKMSATVTPQEKGTITIYVVAGAASSTFYIDPKPVVT